MTSTCTFNCYCEFSRLAPHSSYPIDQMLFSTQGPCSTRHVCLSVLLSVHLLTDKDMGIKTNKLQNVRSE